MNDTAALLDAVCAYVRRFVIVSDDQSYAIALWVLHTYTFEVADATPYLIVTAAERECGKTRLLETLTDIVRKPKFTTGLTEASLFRTIEKYQPTLLIDETDAMFKDSKTGLSERQEALRGILNAGYREGVTVDRCHPNGVDMLPFNVYCPKALAGIGHLPDTIENRGLPIRLTKKLGSEKVDRHRARVGIVDGGNIRTECEQWQAGARIALSSNYPEMPEELDDRAQDAYEQLVAIADLAGKEWSQKGRSALVSLRTEQRGKVREPTGQLLLRDLASMPLKGDPDIHGDEWITSADLLTILYEHGESPWEQWWKGDSSSRSAQMKLSRHLGEYGLDSQQKKIDGHNLKRWKVANLVEAIERYCSFPPAEVDTTDESIPPANPHGYAENTPENGYRVDSFGGRNVPLEGSNEWLGTAAWSEIERWQDEQSS